MSFRGLRTKFWAQTLNLVRFRHPPLNVEWGEGACIAAVVGDTAPLAFGFNYIHRSLWMGIWQSGLQENIHTDGLWCSTVQIYIPSLGEALHESQSNLYFDPQLLGWSWISLMVLAERALHVCLSHQVWPLRSECCGRGAPAIVACAECT